MEPERQTNVKGSIRERRWIYILAGGAVGALAVWAVFAFDKEKDNAESQEKAQELIARFEDQGLEAPDEDIVTRLLGTNGGRVCKMAGEDLSEAALKQYLYANGSGGVGTRAGPVDERLLQGAIIVTEVYCPEKSEALRDLSDDLDFADVIRN